MTDPIFAAIELHRVLWAEYLHAVAIYERLYDALPAATDASGVKTSASPAYSTAVARSQVLCDAALEARSAVLDMPPVTPEGFAAKLRFLADDDVGDIGEEMFAQLSEEFEKVPRAA